jgi:hypothetical protein
VVRPIGSPTALGLYGLSTVRSCWRANSSTGWGPRSRNPLGAQLSKIAVALVFITASIRFALGAIHQLTGRAAWRTPPASSGSCFSHLPFTSRSPPSSRTRQGRTMLPLGRRMRGSLAVVGSLEEQMTHARTRACARPWYRLYRQARLRRYVCHPPHDSTSPSERGRCVDVASRGSEKTDACRRGRSEW